MSRGKVKKSKRNVKDKCTGDNNKENIIDINLISTEQLIQSNKDDKDNRDKSKLIKFDVLEKSMTIEIIHREYLSCMDTIKKQYDPSRNDKYISFLFDNCKDLSKNIDNYINECRKYLEEAYNNVMNSRDDLYVLNLNIYKTVLFKIHLLQSKIKLQIINSGIKKSSVIQGSNPHNVYYVLTKHFANQCLLIDFAVFSINSSRDISGIMDHKSNRRLLDDIYKNISSVASIDSVSLDYKDVDYTSNLGVCQCSYIIYDIISNREKRSKYLVDEKVLDDLRSYPSIHMFIGSSKNKQFMNDCLHEIKSTLTLSGNSLILTKEMLPDFIYAVIKYYTYFTLYSYGIGVKILDTTYILEDMANDINVRVGKQIVYPQKILWNKVKAVVGVCTTEFIVTRNIRILLYMSYLEYNDTISSRGNIVMDCKDCIDSISRYPIKSLSIELPNVYLEQEFYIHRYLQRYVNRVFGIYKINIPEETVDDIIEYKCHSYTQSNVSLEDLDSNSFFYNIKKDSCEIW